MPACLNSLENHMIDQDAQDSWDTTEQFYHSLAGLNGPENATHSLPPWTPLLYDDIVRMKRGIADALMQDTLDIRFEGFKERLAKARGKRR